MSIMSYMYGAMDYRKRLSIPPTRQLWKLPCTKNIDCLLHLPSGMVWPASTHFRLYLDLGFEES
jgi:hypothetical protein